MGTEITKELAAERVAKNLFYLREMMELDDYEFLLARMKGALRRATHMQQVGEADRQAAFNLAKREVMEALESLERPEPRQNLPTRGRLFSHFYLGVRYRCRTARLSEKAHADIRALLQGAIEDIRVEYKGHTIEVRSIQPMS